ncbi:MAG: hypothetical protein ACYS5V_08370 [Planctomycetota bacterium]|jgi:hypothetical protein
MPVYRQPKPIHFTPAKPVEKHFHDCDETWIIMGGRCKAFMIDRDGKAESFELAAGDIWMVEAGVEHGCDPAEEGVDIFPLMGTIPEGDVGSGHLYMEDHNYMPTLQVVKTPIDRYKEI